MFGKLMKYELRYLSRIFVPTWAVVLILCVISRLTVRPDESGMMMIEGSAAILPVLAILLATVALVTMMVVAVVVLIQRFYKGMYGDEGYLMFTLPVTTGQLIHSKGLSAMLMLAVSEIVTVLAVMVMVSYPMLWQEAAKALGGDLAEIFRMLLEMNGVAPSEFVGLVTAGLFTALLETAEGIYMIYLAISIGQLWKKHTVAGGIVAYYVLMAAVGMAESAVGHLLGIEQMEMMMEGVTYGMVAWDVLLFNGVSSLVMLILAFFGTKLILDKKLNIT